MALAQKAFCRSTVSNADLCFCVTVGEPPVTILPRQGSGSGRGAGDRGRAAGSLGRQVGDGILGTPNSNADPECQAALDAFFEQMHGAPDVVVAMGRHRHWTGKMVFFSDGKYFVVKNQKSGRGNQAGAGFSKDSDKAGMWQLNNGKLQLVWFKWNTETLEQKSVNLTFECKSYQFMINFGELKNDWFGLDEAAVENLVASSASAMSKGGKRGKGRANERKGRRDGKGGRQGGRGKKEILPQNYERKKGFVKLRMPTRAERTQILKDKMMDMGENIESGRLLDGSVDPTEVTAFCLGALFDFHQLTTLEMKHDQGKTLCADLLSFSADIKKFIETFKLGAFLERNDEKKISVLEPKVQKIWSGIKSAVEAVPDLDSDSEDEAEVPSPRVAPDARRGAATATDTTPNGLHQGGGRGPMEREPTPESESAMLVVERAVMSSEQLENAVTAMIKEYLAQNDCTECDACIAEVASSQRAEYCKKMVVRAIDLALWERERQQDMICVLFMHLRDAGAPFVSLLEDVNILFRASVLGLHGAFFTHHLLNVPARMLCTDRNAHCGRSGVGIQRDQ